MLSSKLFPPGSVSGVCGPVGVGSTRWLLKAIHDWRQGLPVLGVESPVAPHVYVQIGMRPSQIERIGESMGCDAVEVIDIQDPLSISLPALFVQIPPGAGLVVIENVQELLASGKVNAFRDATDFMNTLQGLTSSLGAAVVVTLEAGKNAKGVDLRPRQRVLGSSQFGRKLDGFVFLDYTGGDTSLERKLFNLPSRGAPSEWRVKFDSAGTPHTSRAPATSAATLDLWLIHLPAGSEILFKDIVEAAEGAGVSRRTAVRWKEKAETEGRIRPIARGVYRRSDPS